ncbi:CASP-like protein 4A2 isoform X2 [Calypte anna]|uniref:CASP-like protein 4A2 isoform X2 n=1 Tax=Calypte anna TaxID=9244 RepID=UPI0011C47804|nr:CASP-like protein 4A2 isoform X2 [Calypte anna]
MWPAVRTFLPFCSAAPVPTVLRGLYHAKHKINTNPPLCKYCTTLTCDYVPRFPLADSPFAIRHRRNPSPNQPPLPLHPTPCPRAEILPFTGAGGRGRPATPGVCTAAAARSGQPPRRPRRAQSPGGRDPSATARTCGPAPPPDGQWKSYATPPPAGGCWAPFPTPPGTAGAGTLLACRRPAVPGAGWARSHFPAAAAGRSC